MSPDQVGPGQKHDDNTSELEANLIPSPEVSAAIDESNTEALEPVGKLTGPAILMSEYSQMDRKWGFPEGTHRSMCGIISTKAALDHYAYRVGGDGPKPLQILEKIRTQSDGWRDIGISHAAEVNYLKDSGLLAWRRNWDAPSADPNWLAVNEGYLPDQIAAVADQQAAEVDFGSDKQAAIRHSIKAMLESENPVIASMKPGYSGNKGQHQVIVRGWGEDETGHEFVVVMDPEPAPGPPGTNERVDPVEYFFDYFNDRAIFMKPRPAA